MATPWVKNLVAALFMCIAIAMFSYRAEAVNCAAIKVPHLATRHYMNYSIIIRWEHTVPNATYTVNGCCEVENGKHKLMNCSKCPVYKQLKNCHAYHNDVTQCQHVDHSLQGITHRFNLTADVPGCGRRHQVSSLHTTLSNAQASPVRNLTLTFQQGRLLVQWLHPTDKGPMKYCYNYSLFKVLDSGERQKLTDGYISTLSVSYGKPHAYTVFRFCVKIRLCEKENVYSDEKCEQKRSPPAAPSQPIKILCGGESQAKCVTVRNQKLRNVTLIWELPEKSSWNGLPTVTKVNIKLKSHEQNGSYSIDLNATQTNKTLPNLRRDGEYTIQLRFCSNGGDGPSTPPIFLSKDVIDIGQGTVEPMDQVIEPKVLVIIIVCSSVVIVAVIIIFAYLMFNSKRKQGNTALPRLTPPAQNPIQSGTDPGLRTNPTDYDFLLLNSEETRMHLDLPDKASSSGSTDSTNDSASCPLVKKTPDTPKGGCVDISYYPEKSGSESGSLRSSGDRSSDS